MFKKSFAVLLIASAAFAQVPAGASGGGRGRGGGRGGPAIKSPEVAADGRVTINLRAPNAKAVTVSGFPGSGPLALNEQGVWTLTTAEPVPAEIYEYTLSVDGLRITDPSNALRHQNYVGTATSVLQVTGNDPWTPLPGPHGTVTRHAYKSNAIGDDRDFYVYTPPNYDRNRKEAYPVLYLLHGLGDDASGWINPGAANIILDNEINSGRAKPMIMVNTLGYGDLAVVAGGRGGGSDLYGRNLVNYQKALFEEVIPVVEKDYNASKNREQRAIAGLSMGGAEATYIGLNNLDKFASVASFSGAYVMWPSDAAPGAGGRGGPQAADPAMFAKNFPTLDAKANAKLKLLWFACGTADSLIGINRQYQEWLKSKDIKFTVEESAGGHTWTNWRHYLSEVAPLLFQTGVKK